MHVIARRLVLALALAGAAAAGFSPGAAEARQYAAVVMDARNGEILHSRNADTRLHPASLTKMMTLYLVIEAVENGRLDLDQRVPVSRHAARQPASKIGFKPGQKVRIRDLIRSAAVRSANDSAVVLAEAVSGSEAAFARLMTQRARDFGMTRTTFKNASGLTAQGHLSTARDMAILGRHVLFDYPEYYNLFGRRSTRAFGRTIWTTNKLLASYSGADGIKTGYTRAAGFNLVATAERGGERVLVSMFGGSSSAARNREVARLLDLGFRRAPTRVATVAPQMGAGRTAPVPPQRPGGGSTPASLFVAGARAVGSALAPAAAHAAETPDEPATLALVDVTAFAPVMGRRPAVRPGARRPIDLAAAANASLAPVVAPTPPPMTDGAWTVLLGSYAEREAAIADLAAAAFGAIPALENAGREIDVQGAGAERRYIASLTGLPPAIAQEACRRLLADGRDCRAGPEL